MDNKMPNQTPKQKKPKPQQANPYIYVSLGLQLVAASGILGFLGYLVDQWLNFSFPIFLLIGIIAGLVASVIKLLKELDKPK